MNEQQVRGRWGGGLAPYLLSANERLSGGPGQDLAVGPNGPNAGVVAAATRMLALDLLGHVVPEDGATALSEDAALRVAEIAATLSAAATLEYRS